MQEDLGNGKYGPNIIVKPGMNDHQYFDQRTSFAFDRVLDLAQLYNVYLAPVIMEKNDWILDRIDFNGNYTDSASNDNFYGDWGTMTKTRWLEQAWWRYLQARWGYSTNIHSWELLNEGDPFNGLHYTLAEKFAQYMHQFSPDWHMVTTSTWTSDPFDEFWNNTNFPDLDYVDVHCCYKQLGVPRPLGSITKATYTIRLSLCRMISMIRRTLMPSRARSLAQKDSTELRLGQQSGENSAFSPRIRTLPDPTIFTKDTQAIWLHNYIWAFVNPSGLYDASYWYTTTHIYNPAYNATNFDHRSVFETYYTFVKDIPLSNGYYVDAQANSSDPNLRVWGQKDPFNGKALLWIANINHTWKNVVDGVQITPITGTVTLRGFSPNTPYTVQWWNTYTGAPTTNQQVATDGAGNLQVSVQSLADDTAVKIGF